MRVIIVSGEGKSFTAGLDLTDPGVDLMGGAEDGEVDVARRAFRLRKHITMVRTNGQGRTVRKRGPSGSGWG